MNVNNTKGIISKQTQMMEDIDIFHKYLENEYSEDSFLYKKAIEIRKKESQDYVYIRAIIDVSNICMCSCRFCGNSSKNKNLKRYRLSKDEVLTAVREAKKLGIDMVHLASGENVNLDYSFLIEIVKEIVSMQMNCELAFGVLPRNVLEKLKDVGLKRIILKFETSNRSLYFKYKDCHKSLDEIVSYLKLLNELGFSVGSGNIVGFKNQTIADLINDLLLMKKLNLSMVSTSCLQPNLDQDVSLQEEGDSKLALRFLSLIRIIMPNKKLCIPTNSTFGNDGKIKAFQMGANEISINFTPKKYKGDYSIYSGGNRIKANYAETLDIIKKAGMKLTTYSKMKQDGLIV